MRAEVDHGAVCTDCPFLRSASEGSWCSIRDVPLDAPERSFCANHVAHAPVPDPIPVGPVMRRDGDTVTFVATSPDDPRIREHLLDLAERMKVLRGRALGFRDSMTIWQLAEFRERRAYVHFDRLANHLQGSGSGLGRTGLEGAFAHDLLQRIARRPIPAGDRDRLFLERFTTRGRVLLFAGLVVGVVSYYLSVVFLLEVVRPRIPVPGVLLAFGAVAVGGLVVAVGAAVFRLLGIPFLVDGEGSAEETRVPPR